MEDKTEASTIPLKEGQLLIIIRNKWPIWFPPDPSYVYVRGERGEGRKGLVNNLAPPTQEGSGNPTCGLSPPTSGMNTGMVTHCVEPKRSLIQTCL